MLLDATEQALQDAGYDRRPFDRRRVGVVVGAMFGDEFSQQLNMALRLPQFQQTLRALLIDRGFPAGDIARDGKYHRLRVEVIPPHGLPPLRASWRQGDRAPKDGGK